MKPAVVTNDGWEDVGPVAAPAANDGDWEDVGPATPAAPKPEVSMTESAVRGGAQGASFGFADELTGFLESVFGPNGKTYRQARNESRAAYKAAEEANPWTYRGAEFAAGVGTGLLTGGAGLAAKAGTTAARVAPGLAARLGTRALGAAAAAGTEAAVSGLGHSEADLTRGEVAEAAKDTAVAGAIGAGLGYGLNRVLGRTVANAPKRALGDLQEDVIVGAQGVKARPKVQQQLAQVAGAKGPRDVSTEAKKVIADLAKEADELDAVGILAKKEYAPIRKALGDTEKARDLIRAQTSRLSKINPKEYEAIDDALGGGVALKRGLDPFKELLDQLEDQPTNGLLKKELETRIQEAERAWAKKIGTDDVVALIKQVVTDEVDEAAASAKGLTSVLTQVKAERAKGFVTPDLVEEVTSNPEAAKEVASLFGAGTKVLDPNRKVPLADWRAWVSDIQNKASTTLGSIDQTTRAPVMGEASRIAKGVLDDILGEAVVSKPELAPAVKKIFETNRDLSVLLTIDRALESRAIKEANKGKGLAETIKGAVKPGAGAALAVLTGNPVALAGPYVAAPVLNAGAKAAGALAKRADWTAAKLAKAAQDGSLTAQVLQAAIDDGLPVGIASSIARFAKDPEARRDLMGVVDSMSSLVK